MSDKDNMPDKTASQLLLESAEPFDKACMMVREMEQQMDGIEETIRDIATEFFRSWYNAPGSNTDQGFDNWWKLNKTRFGFGG